MNATTPASRAVSWVLLASGAAALAHQVVWTRRLVDILGASAETFSRVVGAFCIGLALGSAWAALRPASAASGWRRIAQAELTVAALGALALAAVPLADTLRAWGLGGDGLRVLLPLLLVGPPAVAMGRVLPSALALLPPGRPAVRAYAVNTFGGVAGIGATVFWALPSLGLFQTGLAACGVNLGIAALAFLASRDRGWSFAPPPSEGAPAAADPLPAGAGWVAFTSGFLVLGLEVVAQHQFAQVTINSHFSGSALLVLVLLGLAVASLVAARWPGGELPALRDASLMAAGVWMLQPVLFLGLRPGLQILPYELPPWAYFTQLTLLGLAVLVPGFLVSGCLFPLLLRAASRPAVVARWLALNGAGAWLGAEFTQGILLPALGLWATVLAAAAGYLALGIGLSILRPLDGVPSRIPGVVRWGALGALGILCGFLALTSGRWPQVSPAPRERVVAVAAGREGVVATVVRDTNDWRIVFNNTYTLGGSRAQANQERQAHLPLLLHGNARSVALLGVATGSTLAGAALHSGITRLDAFELSPLAVRFARDHFAPFNRRVFQDPRLHLTLEDARWAIVQQPGAYDVVIGDLFLPWRTGEGRLYTREHFAGVHRSLAREGLFCQWLPLFQLTRSQYDAIVRTFLSEFPNSFLLRGDFYPELPIVGLCGLAGGRPIQSLSWERVDAACQRLRESADPVTDPLVRHAEGVAMCVVGSVPSPAPGPVNTLGNAWLEWDAAHNIVGLRSPWFIGVPEAEYLRDIARQTPNPLPSGLRTAQDAGQFFLTLEVAQRAEAPVLSNLRSQIRDRLPASLRRDTGADWTLWPGRLKPFVAER
ncbi:MAG: hypothetical protein J0L84_08065 [Verrucomicrobia bacterium]|nr:hypothetical protein [Verrucomicrobiota bacterium]